MINVLCQRVEEFLNFASIYTFIRKSGCIMVHSDVIARRLLMLVFHNNFAGCEYVCMQGA